MRKIRFGLVALFMLLLSVTSATAGISIGIGLPTVSIGINLPVYPELVPVPGYPVYYAPQMDANYFFYDGMYWVYEGDNWYASSWYNGPWGIVQPYDVPLFILRVPVSYYRQPPMYFRGWQSNAPPRWGQHWGRDWEQRRSGWNRWNRSSVPAPAPLPVYQRQYTGDRYPRVEQQHTLRNQQYRYQPRDKVIQQHFRQVEQKTPTPPQRGRQEAAPVRSPGQHEQRQQNDQRLQQKQQNDQRQQQLKQQSDQRQQQQQKQQQQPPAAQHQQPPAAQHQQQPPAAQRQQPPAAQHQQQPPAAQRQQPPAAQHQPPAAEQQKQQEPNRERGQGQNRDDERGRGQNRDDERGRGHEK